MRIWPWLAFVSCVLAFFITHHLSKSGHNPPVGFYIAIMGLVAACVTFRKEPSRIEKALWIGVMTILMVAEIRDLYVADAKQAATFRDISDALETTKQGLEAAASSLSATAADMKELLAQTTGGNSYIYFDIGDVSGPSALPTDNYPIPPIVMMSLATPVFKGKYPLHDASAIITGPVGMAEIADLPTRPNQMGKHLLMPYLRFWPNKHRQRVVINFSGSTGNYTEHVMFLKIDDKWTWAAKFYKGERPLPNRLMRQWSSPTFPKDGEDDWNKPDD